MAIMVVVRKGVVGAIVPVDFETEGQIASADLKMQYTLCSIRGLKFLTIALAIYPF